MRPISLPLPAPFVSPPGVDLEFWAHEHSYERLWPVYDYQVRPREPRWVWGGGCCPETPPLIPPPPPQVYNGSTEAPYTNPRAPVHIIVGSAVSAVGARSCTMASPGLQGGA